jgi:hypothetical protein
MTKYRLHLTVTERSMFTEWVQKGKRKAQDIQKAHILLNSDEEVERKSETFIADTFAVSVKTVERVRKEFCLGGIKMFEPKLRQTRSDKKIDARVEAHLITLLCQSPTEEEEPTESEKPKGSKKWKLQMLANRLIELEVVEHISTTMVSKLLKKTNLSLSRRNNG